MIPLQLAYLTLGMLFLVSWSILYYLRPAFRGQMMTVSLLFMPFGVLSELVYTREWWHPLTVTGTRIGFLEAAVTTFGLVGVASVLGILLLGSPPGSPLVLARSRAKRASAMIVVMIACFFGGFFLLGLNSLEATLLATMLPCAFMWWDRVDLIFVSVLNAACLLMLASFLYSVLSTLAPGWIDAFYTFQNTPRLVLLGIPLDDYYFYVATGLFFGSFYRWWSGHLID